MLKRREGFRAAYRGFDVDAVARFGARDVARLMKDEGIIRNRLKIEAAIENARRIVALRASHGGLAGWIDAHHPLAKAEWVKLFKKQFKFMGGEIVGEFLMSIGYLPGAHRETCPAYARIARLKPAWMRA
jgi:DNA-3-methyladenine glycosylase I